MCKQVDVHERCIPKHKPRYRITVYVFITLHCQKCHGEVSPSMGEMSLPIVSDYCLLERIGTGSYATVYKAFKKDQSREIVAIKCVDKGTLSKSAVDNLVTEIRLLNVLKHDHIVEMKDFFWDEGHIYIVMEYCDGGDLSSFIRKKHRLPENICRRFLQQLALALRYLRNHNVCHMDLKPQNLLLMRKPRLTLKVGGW